MRFRGRSAVPVALVVFLLPEAGAQGWRLDRQVALELQQSGAHQETECAILYFETGALSQDQMSTFAGLVEKGVEDIASFLSVPLPKDRKVRYFISSQFSTSHSPAHSIYFPLPQLHIPSPPPPPKPSHPLFPT